ncbi:MAG: 4Fe-4S dicluster domain-containing protein [Methanospirillaceae archaeon]|nr:4Fe-4S dicluster domain-containing protein [Methanospirillaceae archaeon]
MRAFTITRTIVRMLFRGPATIRYPKEPAQIKERSRGHITMDITTCIFCRLCEKNCISQAITVDKEERTWTIDRMRCIICGECVTACPKDCLRIDPRYHPPVTEFLVETLQGPPVPDPVPERETA